MLINSITVNLQTVVNTSDPAVCQRFHSLVCTHITTEQPPWDQTVPLLSPTQATGLLTATGWIFGHFHSHPFILITCCHRFTFHDDVSVESWNEILGRNFTLLHTYTIA